MITDCMRSGLSCRLRAIEGSAVLTMVESSACMKKPAATSQISTMVERVKGTASGSFEGCDNATMPQSVDHARSVRSYVMRAGRITAAQRGALREHWPRYGGDFS